MVTLLTVLFHIIFYLVFSIIYFTFNLYFSTLRRKKRQIRNRMRSETPKMYTNILTKKLSEVTPDDSILPVNFYLLYEIKD